MRINSIKCTVFGVNLVKTIEITALMHWNNQIIVFHYNCKFSLVFHQIKMVCAMFTTAHYCSIYEERERERNYDETRRRRRRECVLECDACTGCLSVAVL